MGKQQKQPDVKPEDQSFTGYPHYPAKEDIYEQDKKELLADEDATVSEVPDLDVPGSELDDQNENIGEEDEENNYYSLGGDEHHNLEEHGED